MVSDQAAEPTRCLDLGLLGGEARLWPAAFLAAQASDLFVELRGCIDWREEQILIFGRRVPVPRLVAWHGDPGASYQYSGTLHLPEPWTPALAGIRDRVAELTGGAFNAVLLNLFHDGRDGMGWHADDEPVTQKRPGIGAATRAGRGSAKQAVHSHVEPDWPHGGYEPGTLSDPHRRSERQSMQPART